MTTALLERGIPELTAPLASELGVLALNRRFAAWSSGGADAGDELEPHVRAALRELQQAGADLLSQPTAR